MDQNKQMICEKSTEFIKKLFEIYFENHDFLSATAMFRKDISWFGTGSREVGSDLQIAAAHIEMEGKNLHEHLKIIDQRYNAAPINDQYCIIYGALVLVGEGADIFSQTRDIRFSMVCFWDPVAKTTQLYHAHLSVPDEQETLTNNLQGGIIRCGFGDSFKVTYANGGFFRMIGYTRGQFNEECNNEFGAILFKDEVECLYNNMVSQLQKCNTTVNENRIRCGDGSIIWVLVKGIVISNAGAGPEFYGVLTDITAQKKIEEELRVSEKRYEIAMQSSNITMFEYNILTKELLLYEKDAKMYGVAAVIPNGMETFIKKGIIEPASATAYREMYSKIINGDPFARCYVNSRDVAGTIREYELNLTNVYDDSGKPVRAIGVRKNVTHMRQLQRENKFGKTLASDKNLVFEADVTNDVVIHMNMKWADESGLAEKTCFTEMVIQFCRNSVAHEYQGTVLRKLAKKNITKAYEQGEKLNSFIYLMKNVSGESRWYNATINIIREQGSLIIRYYTVDISEQKKREIKSVQEKQLFEAMRAKAVVAYEVNITKNLFISGHETWGKLFGITQTSSYDGMIKSFIGNALHPDDREKFSELYLAPNILDAYARGKTELNCEYRRPDESGEYVWVMCQLHLFEDLQSGDVRGYSYIEDINVKKTKELELIYNSEHDLLTGYYNKTFNEKNINKFLSTSEGKIGKHAFFIIDIDYFKSVNDNFGHAFGDVVLSQIASKIKELFRDGDILGRIGGDEFVVFMKNIQNSKVAIAKGQEICDKVTDSYTKNNVCYNIAVSIGIAFYNAHGKSYEELYKHSDTALYVSKENGRRRYTVYSSQMADKDSQAKEIDNKRYIEPKAFEENIFEYVFRILYESNDKEASINTVLELIGKHYNLSRAYIFENSEDGQYTSNTFEWCNRMISVQIENLKNVPYQIFKEFKEPFNEENMFFIHCDDVRNPLLKEMLQERSIKSMLQFAIIRKGELKGFVGFDQCAALWQPTKKEISDLRNISNVLSMFVIESKVMEGVTCQ